MDPAPLLKTRSLSTPLGPMIAIADEEVLYLLEFADCRKLERKLESLKEKMKAPIEPGSTKALLSIEGELKRYFEGTLKTFKTPLFLLGSPFQIEVWEELRKIPNGQTRSYAEIAQGIGRPAAVRAVAQANGANWFPLVIPCHRVINSNGKLGGYSGGLERKRWLLDLESKL